MAITKKASWRLAGAALLLALTLLLAYPPYFAIDAASGGQLHAALGHYPRWAPPPAIRTCQALADRQRSSSQPVSLDCSGPSLRDARFEARINTVRLVLELAAVSLACALTWFAMHTRGRRPAGVSKEV